MCKCLIRGAGGMQVRKGKSYNCAYAANTVPSQKCHVAKNVYFIKILTLCTDWHSDVMLTFKL